MSSIRPTSLKRSLDEAQPAGEQNFCSSLFSSIESLFSGATKPAEAPARKKIYITSDPIKPDGDNAAFFRHLFEELTKDPQYQVNKELDQLSKEHPGNSGVTIKVGIHYFLTKVFSSTAIKTDRDAKVLVCDLYMNCDLIGSEEMFQTLKGKISEKVKEYPSLITYLNKLHFSDSAHKRLLVSHFEDPDQTSFDKDFDRTDFVDKEGFKPLVNRLFKQKQMRNQFLNFFHQGSKAYSLHKIYQHPRTGFYLIKEGSFFLKKDGTKIHFGFYQTGKDHSSNQTVTHYLKITFKTTGTTLIDRYVTSEEKMLENATPETINSLLI